MGLGGALIWTGLAYNLKKKWPGKKVIFLYRKSVCDFISQKHHPDHVIYQNNEDIDCICDNISWYLRKWRYVFTDVTVVNMADPAYSYCEKDTTEKIFYKTGRHAIQIACDVHSISDAELQPAIKLSEKEIDAANHMLKKHNLPSNRYICIEPHSKEGFTPNKAWFWQRWQELVDMANRYFVDNRLDYKLVQVGPKADKVLDGVVDLTGKTTFRQMAQVLKNSITLITYMGGLVHLSKAVGKRSIVLISAWEPLELASYPDDINFYSHVDCQNCGLKVPCPIERECMSQITVDDVFDSLKNMLEEYQL